ncbi:electron transfer flavoprotein subunit alpha/FixB family protein [Pseudonocardia halophobica]|uniref:Electron transfer flavoprotein subunit alpha n=1 Tax=Pseudonocardia halophobica TaxID=29401 RepID=A0A9W6NTX6_9PSEU|nr:electron transfer flavoprotein subunit alpha/FixB family protein [Pseudonocardia halophobica]GLL09730.1 electron transfer flavoprotein subunit alpha [Pseudonocardia halophobica]
MILTLVETDAAGATEVSLEAVTFGRTLARRTGGPVHALVVGARPDGVADQLAGHGVGEVHHATGEAFSAYGGAVWAAAVQAAMAATGAEAVVAPGSPRGLEVMAHLAARLDVPMAANVVGLGTEDDGEALRVTRQVMGGAALEEMLLPLRPAVLTVAGHAVQAEQVPAVSVTLREFSPEVTEADLVTRVVSTEPAAPDLSGALTSAKVVVGAGRGAGGAEGFAGVAELAELLGGALGVSRVVTSMGWRPHHEQIGQTGSRISPDLYIACGISGAIQHWAGCASSKTILAVNTDEAAPMVTKATYAVIGDMHEVVPAINAEIRRRRG